MIRPAKDTRVMTMEASFYSGVYMKKVKKLRALINISGIMRVQKFKMGERNSEILRCK